MSDTGLQIRVTGAMVNGKLDVDLREWKDIPLLRHLQNVQDLPVVGVFDVILHPSPKTSHVEVVLLIGID